MERYVSEKLAQDKSRLNETFRRPLLHYTAYCNKRKPNLGMAKILLDHDADVNNVFRDRSQPGESKTALESMDFSFPQDEGHSHTSYIRLLVEAGATLPGRIPYHGRPNDWRTVLHQIMEMPMASTPKLEMVKLFHDHGVSLEEKNSAGETVFEKIFRRNIRVPVEDAICMLEHGAKVQPWMVQQIYQPNNMHPLKDPNCRKPEYYTEAAREAALVHNQDWNLT